MELSRRAFRCIRRAMTGAWSAITSSTPNNWITRKSPARPTVFLRSITSWAGATTTSASLNISSSSSLTASRERTDRCNASRTLIAKSIESSHAIEHKETQMPVTEEIVQKDFEVEIQARIDAERARLRAEAGLARMREFKKPVERTFTAAERDYVTILFGGLTWKHEEMIKAVFHGSGYRCEN